MADELPDVEGANGMRWEAKPVTVVDSEFYTGRCFIAGTGVQSVQSGNKMFSIIGNPANSGRNLILVKRIFSNDEGPNDDSVEFEAWVNPTAVLSTPATVVPLIFGGTPSVMESSFQIAPSDDVTMGGIQALGEILPRGVPHSVDFKVLMPPGFSLGFTVSGGGQNVSQALRLSIRYEFYEDDL